MLLSDILPTAWHSCELGEVGPGDRVAIWGAGPGKGAGWRLELCGGGVEGVLAWKAGGWNSIPSGGMTNVVLLNTKQTQRLMLWLHVRFCSPLARHILLCSGPAGRALRVCTWR